MTGVKRSFLAHKRFTSAHKGEASSLGSPISMSCGVGGRGESGGVCVRKKEKSGRKRVEKV